MHTLAQIRNRVHAAVQFRKRDWFDGRFVDHCEPVAIAVLMTDHCTARCVHCDIWKNNQREDSLSVAEWKQFFDDLRDWLGPVHFTITGGEALMKPWVPELVAHASNIGLITEVLTHGYWEDQGKIERLAKAHPWKITISLDGIGETHTVVRGRPKFWERTSRSIETLLRMREQQPELDYIIRLKHVLMNQNMGEAVKVAHFGNRPGMEVCYQPVAQNYNTPEDAEWYLSSANFPTDIGAMTAQIRELMRLREHGFPIVNSLAEFEGMIAYFEDPAAHRTAASGHILKETRRHCAALTNLEVRPDGLVYDCPHNQPAGNLKYARIREIWNGRRKVWRGGCCLDARLTNSERSVIVPAEYLISGKT